MSIGHSEPAPGVDQWAMGYLENIPVEPTTQYGEREHITMQVRNAPNGQRATRQVATGGVTHFDVQTFPKALHINLYSDTSAGWLFMRRDVAEQLYDVLGRALGATSPVTSEIDAAKPPEHSETNYSELHGPF